MRRPLGLIGLAALLAAAGGAAAQTSASDAKPPTVEDRISGYFNAPDAPETFRALSGRGDPHIAAVESWRQYYYVPRSNADAGLMRRLTPQAEGPYASPIPATPKYFTIQSTSFIRVATLLEARGQ
jgi:hypothetical protein